MREHHALGQPGRARGVGEHDDVVEVDGDLVRERRALNRRDRRVAVGIADDEHLRHGRVGDRRGDRLEEHRDGDEACRAGVDELVVDLARRVGGVDRGEHTARQGDGVEDDPVLGTVGRHHGDDLALREPTLEPARGLTADGGLELAIGHRPPGGPVDERGPGGPLVGVLQDVRRQGQGRQGDRRQWTGERQRPTPHDAGNRTGRVWPLSAARGRGAQPREEARRSSSRRRAVWISSSRFDMAGTSSSSFWNAVR